MVLAYYDSGVEYCVMINNKYLPIELQEFIKNFYSHYSTELFVSIFSKAYNCDIYIIENGYIEYFEKGEAWGNKWAII